MFGKGRQPSPICFSNWVSMINSTSETSAIRLSMSNGKHNPDQCSRTLKTVGGEILMFILNAEKGMHRRTYKANSGNRNVGLLVSSTTLLLIKTLPKASLVSMWYMKAHAKINKIYIKITWKFLKL